MFPIDNKQSDFKTTITKALAKDPDALFVFAFGPAAGLLPQQIAELNYEGIVYSSIGIELTPGVKTSAKEALSGTYHVTYEKSDAFQELFEETH